MNGYSLISHKLCTDQYICSSYRFGEGEEGWNFFSLVSQRRALNKEQCPIYWRVVLMMIRLALCSLNVVGMYLKFDFKCRCTICFFVVWLCPVPICTCYRRRVGWFTVVSWRNNNYTLCARDIFLLVSLLGFKLNILVK